MSKKTFLFLQGPVSPFFKQLGNKLKNDGHKLLKVNFTGGDKLFWDDEDCIEYPHQEQDWKSYIADIARLRRVTDLVVYSDSSPAHKQAIDALSELGIKTHVFEEGYLGQNFVTLEQGGVNATSSLPRDPMFYMRENTKFFDEITECEQSYSKMMFYAVQYYMASLSADQGNFKNRKELGEGDNKYASWSWASRVATSISRKLYADMQKKQIAKSEYYLVTLQPESDWKINHDSNVEGVEEFIEQIIASFAKHAPENIKLVFKNHPLDNGTMKLKSKIRAFSKEYGIRKKVEFLDGGRLTDLVKSAKGLVTLNSSSAMIALENGIPVKTLAGAVYDVEGLTNQATLNVFWKGPRKPSESLYIKFSNYLRYKTQVNGNFYSPKGINIAVENSRMKILGLDGSSYYQENVTAG